jgi:hypothetical protein
MDSVKYIGMDVHKEAISIAVLNSSGKLADAQVSCASNFAPVPVNTAMRQHPLVFRNGAIPADEPLPYRGNRTVAHPLHCIRMSLSQDVHVQHVDFVRFVGKTGIDVDLLGVRFKTPPRFPLEKPRVTSESP